jgi:hypothetical protein
MVGIVIDAKVQVEPRRRNLVALIGLEVHDLDKPFQRPAHVNAGGVRSDTIVEGQGDTVYSHGMRPSGGSGESQRIAFLRRAGSMEAEEMLTFFA